MQDCAMVIQVRRAILCDKHICIWSSVLTKNATITIIGGPLLYKASDTSQYLLKGVLNRILNAYDPDPANTSCPLRQDINSDFVNLFVKTSSHIDWISEVTGLPKSAFMEPAKPSNNSHLFSTTISMSSRLQINAWKLLLPTLLLLSLLFPIM